MTITVGQIREHLQNGGTVEVCGVWRYKGNYMCCYNNADFPCCEDFFSSIEEAVESILDKAEDDLSYVNLD